MVQWCLVIFIKQIIQRIETVDNDLSEDARVTSLRNGNDHWSSSLEKDSHLREENEQFIHFRRSSVDNISRILIGQVWSGYFQVRNNDWHKFHEIFCAKASGYEN